MHFTQIGSTARTLLITLLAIGVFMAIAVTMLPKGFNHDTSIIGQGSNVVVLAHDKNSIYSLNLMEILNQVRSDYATRVEFLVVDSGTNEGQAFIQKEQATLGELLLFGKDGIRREVLINIEGEEILRAALDDVFFDGKGL
ncbi:MAG: hypothetical protein GXP08_04150 [Gammaproteobacteria bacterium]|nr:hypothetical protein [Gammaproteobacteria bacterium]